MRTKKGIAVSEGIAIAKAIVLDSNEYQIPHRVIDVSLCSSEVDRVNKAFDSAVGELLEFETKDHELAQKKNQRNLCCPSETSAGQVLA